MNDEERPTGSQAPSDADGAEPPRSLVGRMRAAQSRATDEMTEVRTRLEEARPRSRTIDSAFLALARDTETGAGVLAAALAFRVFMFIIPYVFVVILVFDVGGGVADKDPQSVAKSAGIGGLLAQAVSGSAQHLTGVSRYVALLAGLIAAFLAARVLVKTLRIVHGLVWRVPVKKLARPGLAVVVLVVLVSIALVLSAAVDRLRHASSIGGLGATILYTALPFGIWWALEYGLPHAPDVGWKDLLPGAILFGVAALALHLFTVYYVARLIRRRSATYGALGAALALLFWAYVFGRIMTASAVLNASMWARSHRRDEDEAAKQSATPTSEPGDRSDVNEVIDRLSGPDAAH